MAAFHYALGLDIGISSVGWAVLRNNGNGEPEKIEKLGVRIFDKAEHPKTGASLALPRREARSARRQVRRHRHRLERIKLLLETSGIMTRQEIKMMYQQPQFSQTPYQLRVAALDRLLTNEELVRVLIHLAQRRGYKSNSTAEEAQDEKVNGKVKAAIAENFVCMEKNGYQTIGEMMLRDERFWETNPDGSRYPKTRNKADDYRFTVARKDVVAEIQKIFQRQREQGSQLVTEQLGRAYLTIFESQRNFDAGPGGNSPFAGGIATKIGSCTFETGQPRAAKATYTFEYFKLLQDLNHMRLVGNGLPPEPIDPAQREQLITVAMQSPSLTYGQLRKKLALNDDIFFNDVYYGDKERDEAEKRKWSEMQSYHKIRQALDRVEKGAINALTQDQLDDIGTILTVFKNDSNRIEELKQSGIPACYHQALLDLSFSKFGSLSVCAMKKMIPYLQAQDTYDKACTKVYGDHRGLQNVERKLRLSINDLEPITNPVVRRAISQTIKVVNAITRTNGAPDVVRIELARDMGRNFDDRRKMEKRQEDNRVLNERIKSQVEEYKGDHASGLDIVKFKLFQEQDGVCMYSGKNLDIARLSEPGYVDIDHIIPYSRCFDDSYMNKVLTLSSENRQKGNRLPYEYLGSNEQKWYKFETRVESSIHNYRKRQKLLKQKLSEEESQAFIQRNLTDTQHITRTVYNLLRNNMQFAESKYSRKPVQSVNGGITAQLRGRWGIQKIRENGDLHHSIDAVVIACTSPGMIHRLTEYSKQQEYLRRTKDGYLNLATGELLPAKEYDEVFMPHFPQPWEYFTKEMEARLDPVNPRHMIDLLGLNTYESDEEIKPVFVSRMPNHKVSGAAHADTIRSGKAPGNTVTKTQLSALKLNKEGEIDGYYNPESDRLLYKAIKARLELFGGKGEQAFSEPFYKPKADGTMGPRVDKVKIMSKSTLNLPINGGLAANGDMVRVDVFHVEDDGYYFVPVYVANTKEKELPNKAVVAYKAYEQWKIMKPQDFLFSLYPGDLIRVKSRKGVKLKLVKGGSGEKEIFRKDALYYYRTAGITVGVFQVETHDRRYEQPSLGVKTLELIQKYQVDVLGNCTPVRLPEKRMGFIKTTE